MNFEKSLVFGLACVSLAILSQGCGDDPASTPIENSQYSSFGFIESSSDASLFELSSSSDVSPSSSIILSSSTVVAPNSSADVAENTSSS